MPSEEPTPELRREKEPDGGWLTPAELRTWMAFMAAIYVVDTALDRDLRTFSELSHNDYKILSLLSNAPGQRLRMSKLADLVFGSRSRLTYQVTQLERAGLVRREECSTDKRGAVAVLTPQGQHVLRTVTPKHVASIRRIFFDQLTDEQAKVLGEALLAIIAGQGWAKHLEGAIERELMRGQNEEEGKAERQARS